MVEYPRKRGTRKRLPTWSSVASLTGSRDTLPDLPRARRRSGRTTSTQRQAQDSADHRCSAQSHGDCGEKLAPHYLHVVLVVAPKVVDVQCTVGLGATDAPNAWSAAPSRRRRSSSSSYARSYSAWYLVFASANAVRVHPRTPSLCEFVAHSSI